jgi:hypothetical protein
LIVADIIRDKGRRANHLQTIADGLRRGLAGRGQQQEKDACPPQQYGRGWSAGVEAGPARDATEEMARWFGTALVRYPWGRGVCVHRYVLVFLHVHAAMQNACTRKESMAANYHGGAKSSISKVGAILTKENNLRLD